MAKLFILGDSFSYPHKTQHKLWTTIAAEQLAKKTGTSIEIVNYSLIGASQDYVWKKLDEVLLEITPDDFLLIILTSCDRFWYFEKNPEHSNLMSIENINQATADQNLQNALVNFISHIWRPSLAMQLQDHRLGYLSYHVLKHKLRKPLIVKAFEFVFDQEEKFPELNFTAHSLARIQLEEFEEFDGEFRGGDAIMDKAYWHHIDCRYNHMCLSNHAVLGDLIGQTLHTGQPLSLESDQFHKGLINLKNYKDKDFAAKEFCLKYFNEMLSNSLRQKFGAKSFRLFF